MTTQTSDAIPTEVQARYLSLMKEQGAFWYDMTKLSLDFGMRNIEVRELKASDINLNDCTITLSDSKQVRSYITKQSNKAINDDWLIQGRKLLRGLIDSDLAPLLVRLANDTKQLEQLADEYGLLDEYLEEKDNHYAMNIDEAIARASKTAPKGRVINFSRYIESKRIIIERVKQYGHLCDYLFPVNELKSNRATGFEPVSRQSVYRVIKLVTDKVKQSGHVFNNALKMVRIGLHSARKACVQKVASTFDIMAASIFIGHGDVSMTQKYLDRSERKIHDINNKLAELQC